MIDIDAIKLFFDTGKRKEAVKLIYSAEVSLEKSGQQIAALLKILARGLKEPNDYLETAIRLHRKGKPRSVVYQDILPDDMLNILKTVEAEGLDPSQAFQHYVPLKKKIDKAVSRMKSALKGPTGSYLAACALGFFGLSVIYYGFSNLPKLDLSRVAMMKTCFLPATLIPIAALHFAIMRYPHLVPKWKRVYNHVTVSGYLLVVKTIMITMSLSSAAAVSYLLNMDDKQLKKNIKESERTMEGVVKILSYYLTEPEMSLLTSSSQMGCEGMVLTGIVEQRMDEIDEIVTEVTEGFNTVFKLLSMLPVGIVIYAYVTTIIGVMRLSHGF